MTTNDQLTPLQRVVSEWLENHPAVSQRELSRSAGLNDKFVASILSGKAESPRAMNLRKLSRAMGMAPGALAELTDDENLDAAQGDVASIRPEGGAAAQSSLKTVSDSLDMDFLRIVITKTEQYLVDLRVTVPPDKKADLYFSIYDLEEENWRRGAADFDISQYKNVIRLAA